MVRVGIVWVLMAHRRMMVPVRVRLSGRGARAMTVLVMVIVGMAMFMVQRLVRVFMLVPLGKVQPDAHSHQRRCADQREGDRFAEQDHRQGRPKERGRREESASPRRAHMAQAQGTNSTRLTP